MRGLTVCGNKLQKIYFSIVRSNFNRTTPIDINVHAFTDRTILVSNALSNKRTTIAPLRSFVELLKNFAFLVHKKYSRRRDYGRGGII